MPDADDSSLFEIFALVDIHPIEPVNFLLTDTKTTGTKVRLLSTAAKYFNVIVITAHGGRSGVIRQEGLVDQVVASAFQTFSGHDPRPDPFDKAAMLLRGITQGHPFTDGNKRTGFLVATFYLKVMGYPIPYQADNDEVVDFCVHISAGDIRDVREIADGLRRLWNQV